MQGQLEQHLRAGQFAITAETSPPDSGDAAAVTTRTDCLRGLADAVNVTDGSGARAHMSALATAAILVRHGIEPVLQFTMRDRNRLALQGDLMGAAALGIPNILCLRGDDITSGDQPDAKSVHDVDTKGLVRIARQMRDEGCLPSGRRIDSPPRLFIGAADAPPDVGAGYDSAPMLAKIDAGADFFQTQFVFDVNVANHYVDQLWELGLPERAYFLIGIGPLASVRSARWMNANLFGVQVPEPIITRLAAAKDQRAEGRLVCLELIQQLKEIKGVHGVHLMGPRQEEAIAQVIAESGLRNGGAG